MANLTIPKPLNYDVGSLNYNVNRILDNMYTKIGIYGSGFYIELNDGRRIIFEIWTPGGESKLHASIQDSGGTVLQQGYVSLT